MVADQRRPSRSGEDCISGLPDELLHDILVRLGCAHAAARTSVLSRRWRHVWAHLPELHLDQWRRATTSGSFLDTVDAALAGYSAPTLEYLGISSYADRAPVLLPGRIAPWLQFAAEHVVGELFLQLYVPQGFLHPGLGEPMLELPVCERAKRIELSFTQPWRLRPQAAGLFTALTSLGIFSARMGGAELTALVCTQCPSLRDLALFLELIAGGSDVSLHSSSLRSLVLRVGNTRRLEVVAPKLEDLTVDHQPVEAHISAPKLVMVAWHADVGPHLNRLTDDVGRSLRLLETNQISAVPFLTKQFNEVDELKLSIHIPQGVAGYGSFLNETNKLPKCKSFRISLTWDHHALVPSMSHLLKRCNSTKKISILLLGSRSRPLWDSCPLSCPCRLEENHKIDSSTLSSLEEVEISDFTDSLEDMELVELLSSNAVILKRLVINYMMFPDRPITKEVCEKIRSMCRHRRVKVKFHVFHDARLVPFD